MTYIDPLDSAKTAHPEEGKWWRPETKEQQDIAIALAHAEVMIRLLHGETIDLSNNQAIDSVAWFRAVEHISVLQNLPWPPARVVFHGLSRKPVPDSLVELTIKNLKDMGFVFSALIGMDEQIRKEAAKNLRNNIPFDRMFDDVGVDPANVDLLAEHACALRRFHEYLSTWRNPGEVCTETEPHGLKLWDQIQGVRDKPKGIPGGVLDEISRIVSPVDLDRRGSLYGALGSIMGSSPDLRDHIRQYIDRFYNHQLSKSVAGGKGAFTMSEISHPTTISDQGVLDDTADSVNTPDGVVSRMGLSILPDEAKRVPGLDWENVVTVLAEPRLQNSAQKLQKRLNALDPKQPDYREQCREALHEHHTLLAEMLAPKVVTRSGRVTLVATLGPFIGTAIGTTVGYAIGDAAGSAIGAVQGKAIAELIKLAVPELAVGRAAGRIRGRLDSAVKLGR